MNLLKSRNSGDTDNEFNAIHSKNEKLSFYFGIIYDALSFI
jgi:hypothetical protein